MRALIQLQSTGLVPKIYDCWTCKKKGYIIMEKLYNCENIDPHYLFEKVKIALETIRQAGWLHVDTHDGNVMCTSDGKVVIIDFGYAVERGVKGDAETYGKHPKSQRTKDGWGVPLTWKFLSVLQEVNLNESFNPYGSRDRKIRKSATIQDKREYLNMEQNYKNAKQNLKAKNRNRYGDISDETFTHNLNE